MYDWLDVRDACILDTAIQARGPRAQVLYALTGAPLESDKYMVSLDATTAIDYYEFHRWIQRRRVKIRFKIYLPGAFNYLQCRLPCLRDVVGSADRGTSRELSADLRLGGVHHFTAHSILRVLTEMKLPDFGRGVSLLDAGCGNCILAVIVRMLYPYAQVNVVCVVCDALCVVGVLCVVGAV
jgi:hypothetical protein